MTKFEVGKIYKHNTMSAQYTCQAVLSNGEPVFWHNDTPGAGIFSVTRNHRASWAEVKKKKKLWVNVYMNGAGVWSSVHPTQQDAKQQQNKYFKICTEVEFEED